VKHTGIPLLFVVALVGVVTASIASNNTSAQTGNPEATIAALQTEVAKYKATSAARGDKINAQRTQIAELTNPQPTPTPAAEVGKSVTAGSWRITFQSTEIRPTAGQGSNTVTARGIFLVVNFSLENTETLPAEFPFMDLRVIDAEGRTFSVIHDATFFHMSYAFDLFPNEEIQPGLPYNFAVVFDVPTDASGFQFTTGENRFRITLDR
jgi:hypothetical protein